MEDEKEEPRYNIGEKHKEIIGKLMDGMAESNVDGNYEKAFNFAYAIIGFISPMMTDKTLIAYLHKVGEQYGSMYKLNKMIRPKDDDGDLEGEESEIFKKIHRTDYIKRGLSEKYQRAVIKSLYHVGYLSKKKDKELDLDGGA